MQQRIQVKSAAASNKLNKMKKIFLFFIIIAILTLGSITAIILLSKSPAITNTNACKEFGVQNQKALRISSCRWMSECNSTYSKDYTTYISDSKINYSRNSTCCCENAK